MPGEMNWEDMNWLFTDFTDTGLIYHGTRPENLPGIFADGLVPGKITDPTERHETIYEAHYRHRPDWIPRWVDPRHCIFGYTNRRRQGNLNTQRRAVNQEQVASSFAHLLNVSWRFRPLFWKVTTFKRGQVASKTVVVRT